MNFPCRFKRIMQSLGFFVKTISPQDWAIPFNKGKASPGPFGSKEYFS